MYRGVCPKHGYATLVVSPLKYRGDILGVIHLADEQPSLLVQEDLLFIESITPLIGEANHRFHTEDNLRKQSDINESIGLLANQLISSDSMIESIANTVLQKALILSDSPSGLVGSIDPANGDMVAHTLTEMMQKGSCKIALDETRSFRSH